MSGPEHVACIRDIRNASEILVGKSKKIRLLEGLDR